jgi:hypothetical protein
MPAALVRSATAVRQRVASSLLHRLSGASPESAVNCTMHTEASGWRGRRAVESLTSNRMPTTMGKLELPRPILQMI